MASKTRSRSTKASKENIGVVKTKSKAPVKVLKPARKPLSDKTNSASDDNASVVSDKSKPVGSLSDKQTNKICDDNGKRPRRARRLPTRYKENNILKNLSNSINLSTSNTESPAFKTPSPVQKKTKVTINEQVLKNPVVKITPLDVKKTSTLKKIKVTPSKSPINSLECSVIQNRPKRIGRLPSKFEDHSISPNKYIPLQPINASTPLTVKTKKVTNNNLKTDISAIENITKLTQPNLAKSNGNNTNVSPELITKTETRPKRAARAKKVTERNENHIGGLSELPTKRKTILKAVSKVIGSKGAADPNNNANKTKAQKSPSKSPGTPVKIFKSKRVLNKHTSIRLLDDNKNKLKRDSSKLDVYEFTFDPDEEPTPAKKKKKKAAPRKPKQKTVPLKSKYDKNLAKALAALKNTLSTKSSKNQMGEVNKNVEHTTTSKDNAINIELTDNHIKTVNTEHLSAIKEQSIVNEKNYNSVRVEDIARDFHMDEDNHGIDYSPVNSPNRPKTPLVEVQSNVQAPSNKDPLNLRDDSFFDEMPVASSSMNVSVRHPQASPWRAEFGSLPIKWQVNTYVKPNMTPAFESSFINFNDSKKKHVYTNIIPEVNDPVLLNDNTSNLKQTSIISFIKEVVEKSANKKNKKSTPIKANSLFEDLTITSVTDTPNKETPLKNNTNKSRTPESEKHNGNSNSNVTNEKTNLSNVNNENVKTTKDLDADKDNTYFGFDEVEDQENISPVKKNNRAKSLRSRTRAILKEINDCKGPTRGNIPVVAKSKSVQNEKITEMKSATEPPVFPEVAVDGIPDTTNVPESCVLENSQNDDQSVHLFEDIDLLCIHHPKPVRKSYGKAKKVTFIQNPIHSSDDNSLSDTDVGGHNCQNDSVSSEEDNLKDLSFKLPTVRPKKVMKKKKPKKQLSKKEEKEVEEWAAGFNSMCEDIDGFDLVVE